MGEVVSKFKTNLLNYPSMKVIRPVQGNKKIKELLFEYSSEETERDRLFSEHNLDTEVTDYELGFENMKTIDILR